MAIYKRRGCPPYEVINEEKLIGPITGDETITGMVPDSYMQRDSVSNAQISFNNGSTYAAATIVTNTPTATKQVRPHYSGFKSPMFECYPSDATGGNTKLKVSYTGLGSVLDTHLLDLSFGQPETPTPLAYTYDAQAGSVTVNFTPMVSPLGTPPKAALFRVFTNIGDVIPLMSYLGGAVTSHTFTDLPDNFSGYVDVRYQDERDRWSSYSTRQQVTNYHTPSAPTSITVTTATATSIAVTLGGNFADDLGHTEGDTEWQIDTGSGYGASEGAADHVTHTFTVPSGATCNIKARRNCSGGQSSAWREITGIVASATDIVTPAAPTIASPSAGTLNVTTAAMASNWGHDDYGTTQIFVREVGGSWPGTPTWAGAIGTTGAGTQAVTVANDKKYEVYYTHTDGLSHVSAASGTSTGVWVIGNAPQYNLVGSTPSHMFGVAGELDDWASLQTYGTFTCTGDRVTLTATNFGNSFYSYKDVGSFASSTVTLLMKMRLNMTTLQCLNSDQTSYVQFRFNDGTYMGQFRISAPNNTPTSAASLYAFPGSPVLVGSAGTIPLAGEWFYLKCAYNTATGYATFSKSSDGTTWTAIGGSVLIRSANAAADGLFSIYAQEKYANEWVGTKTVEIALLELY